MKWYYKLILPLPKLYFLITDSKVWKQFTCGVAAVFGEEKLRIPLPYCDISFNWNSLLSDWSNNAYNLSYPHHMSTILLYLKYNPPLPHLLSLNLFRAYLKLIFSFSCSASSIFPLGRKVKFFPPKLQIVCSVN